MFAVNSETNEMKYNNQNKNHPIKVGQGKSAEGKEPQEKAKKQSPTHPYNQEPHILRNRYLNFFNL